MIPYVLGLNNKLLLSIFFISIELLYDFSIFFLYCKHTLYYGDCARERILFMVYSVYKYIHWMLNSINCVLPLFWFLFLWVNRFLFVIYLFVSDANCVNFIWMCLCERCILFVLANYFIIVRRYVKCSNTGLLAFELLLLFLYVANYYHYQRTIYDYIFAKFCTCERKISKNLYENMFLLSCSHDFIFALFIHSDGILFWRLYFLFC